MRTPEYSHRWPWSGSGQLCNWRTPIHFSGEVPEPWILCERKQVGVLSSRHINMLAAARLFRQGTRRGHATSPSTLTPALPVLPLRVSENAETAVRWMDIGVLATRRADMRPGARRTRSVRYQRPGGSDPLIYCDTWESHATCGLGACPTIRCRCGLAVAGCRTQGRAERQAGKR